VDGRAASAALLERFGLESYAARAPAEVSLGEQQRTALGRAMILEPRVLLADEPSGHQDAEWAARVFQAFRWIAGKGTSCLVATHSQEFLKLVDRTVTMRDGQVTGGE
jgi:putative ABC transport system ATP-binding protein